MIKAQVKIEQPIEVNSKKEIDVLLSQLDELANKVGGSIEKMCQKQEEKFLNDYKEQMYQAKKNLSIYEQNNTEEEIKKKMKEKQLELRQKRENTLSDTIKISNQLKELKIKLHEITMNAENVADEIKFIDEQMIMAEEKNRNLRIEVERLKIEVLKVDPNFKFWDEDTNLNTILPIQNERASISISIHEKLQNSSLISKQDTNEKIPSSVEPPKKKSFANLRMAQSLPKLVIPLRESNPRLSPIDDISIKDINRLKKEIENQKNIYEKLKDLYYNDAFYAGRFETVFLDCIRRVNEKGKDMQPKQPNVKLPMISPPKITQGDGLTSLDEIHQPKRFENIAELSLSEIDKKNIMEEFLQNGLVKEFLYQRLVATSKQYRENDGK